MSSARRWHSGQLLLLLLLAVSAALAAAAPPPPAANATATPTAAAQAAAAQAATNITKPAVNSTTVAPALSPSPPSDPRFAGLDCPPLPSPAYGALRVDNSSRAAIVFFRCQLGRELVGPKTSKCQRNGKWTNPVPACVDIGLRGYPQRAALASAGLVSIHDEAVVTGLMDAAQKKHNCIGFSLRVKGAHKAWLLRDDESLSELIPSPAHVVYLFQRDGRLKRYPGYRAHKKATMEAVDFATNAAILKGLKKAAAAKHKSNNNIIGFTIAQGKEFRASLLGWEGLPLQKSKSRHAFTLREEVEEKVKEVGCYRAAVSGQSPFATRTALSEEVTVRNARIVCASIAREKNQRYFAVSERFCYSGNNAPYGTLEVVDSAAKSRASCAIPFVRALTLNLTAANSNAVIGAGAAKDFFHTFQLDPTLMIVPDLHNGGFEEQQLLVPIFPRVNASVNCSDEEPVKPPGRQSIAFSNTTFLRNWHVETQHGEIGMATYGSEQLANLTVPEGINVLYMQNEGSITQLLAGLEVGKRYTLRFLETFRRTQRAGLSLTVQLGSSFVIYHNPFVSTPLWSKRQVDFTATQQFQNITFRVQASNEPPIKGGLKTADSTVLIDQIRLSRKGFSSVKVGMVGKAAHGRVATINSTHPAIAKAFLKVTQQQAKLGNGGLGFRMQDGVPAAIGSNDLKTLKKHAGSSIFLNNGTVIKGHTTAMHSGMLSVKHPWVLKAIARVAEKIANSVAFSVHQNVRQGVQAIVLAPSALPLVADDNYVTYFFTPHIDDLGCWSVPKGGRVLKTLHPITDGPASRISCSEAAARLDHDYFALQEGGQCVSGRADPRDASDDLFWTAGRSAQCDVLCANGLDNCGGKGAATVYRLMPYTLVSQNGQAATDPLVLPREVRNKAQNVFDEPGKHYFTTVLESELKAARDHKALRSLSNSTLLSWSHPLLYHFAGSQTYAVAKYVIQAPALTRDHPATPSAWTFEGSNDGLKWMQLDKQEHVAFYTGQRRAFLLRNNRSFHFHRLVVTDNGGLGVAGFGIQGFSLYARTDNVRFLKALYRFENSEKVGWDSSIKNNDLEVFGAAAEKDSKARFGITRKCAEVKHGKGALRISNPAGTAPSYLALDKQLSLPSGIPAGSGSFSVAFWFHVDSERDGEGRFARVANKPRQLTILSWGSSKEEAALNAITIDSEFLSLSNSFGRGEGAALRTPITEESRGLLNKWHHFAVSYDSISGEHRVFLNTKLVASRIYRNPKFSVVPEQFSIGARRLPTKKNPVGDEFNGLLDDIAVFNGPLTHASVRAIAGGAFRPYLPMSCQDISDRYWVEAGVTWGEASTTVKERFMRNKCYTKSLSCQMLSDLFGMTPSSGGKAGFYARKQYKRQKCATWPSILTRADTAASCAPGSRTTVQNVRSRRAALELCSKAGHRCQSYQYAGETGNEKLGIKAFQLDMCATYLSDLRHSPGTQITTRISKYLLHPDSKVKCDSHDLPTHNNVPSSIHARWLCDSTPGCAGYVWSGVKGTQPGKHDPIPMRAILCGSIRKGKIYHYPGSGHEVGEKLGSYVVLPERYAECSKFSTLASLSNVTSSLQARRECDRMDGHGDVPKCYSYAWDRSNNVARLCSSVPQSAVQHVEDVELGLATPQTCQAMSDTFAIQYGESWGFAPFEVKAMFHTHNCSTSPSSCQQLSDHYRLSPNVTAKIAAQVPGVVRDQWLRQGCITQPQIEASQFFLSATFSELQGQIDRVKAQIHALNRRVLQLGASTLLPAESQKALVDELQKAQVVLQQQLDELTERQKRELQPLLARAAESEPTTEQANIIHGIADALYRASVPRT